MDKGFHRKLGSRYFEDRSGRLRGGMQEPKVEKSVAVCNVYLVVEVDLFMDVNVVYCFSLRMNCYGRF